MKPGQSRKNTATKTKTNEKQQDVSNSKNYNESSCQPHKVRLVSSDNSNSGVSCVCKCGESIVANNRSLKVQSPGSVVTYKKKIGPGKMLVVKQEVDQPEVTPWIIANGFMIMFFLLLLVILIEFMSWKITKTEEMMSLTTLLLFILVCFRPRYFIPYLLFQPSKERCQDVRFEECDDDQYEC